MFSLQLSLPPRDGVILVRLEDKNTGTSPDELAEKMQLIEQELPEGIISSTERELKKGLVPRKEKDGSDYAVAVLVLNTKGSSSDTRAILSQLDSHFFKNKQLLRQQGIDYSPLIQILPTTQTVQLRAQNQPPVRTTQKLPRDYCPS